MIEDFLIDYVRRTGEPGDEAVLPDLDLKRFAERGAPGLTLGRVLKTSPKQAVGLDGIWQFLSRQPMPLVPTDEEIDDERDWLRMIVPINLRRAENMLMPMANSVSSVFLDRQPCNCSDADQLLAGIQEEMDLINRMELQYTFLFSLGLARLMPGGLIGRTRASKCEISCCLSNLGPVLGRLPLPRLEGRVVAGNVVLDAVDFIIPQRPFIDASFCVYTYAGRLSVLMHPHPETLCDADAKELLSDFLARVCHSAGIET